MREIPTNAASCGYRKKRRIDRQNERERERRFGFVTSYLYSFGLHADVRKSEIEEKMGSVL